MEEKEYFVLGDKKFAIPSDKVDGFISKYPDAQKAKFYDNVNGKKYYIPLDKVDAFEEKFALKKNEKNQLQEKDITEDSSTVAEPLQESGGETNYLVNDTAVTRDDLERNLSNDEFIQKVRSGEFNIQVSNDPALEKELENKIKPPSDKAIDKTIQNISGNDESTVKILGRSFQSGLAYLSADIYRTPRVYLRCGCKWV